MLRTLHISLSVSSSFHCHPHDLTTVGAHGEWACWQLPSGPFLSVWDSNFHHHVSFHLLLLSVSNCPWMMTFSFHRWHCAFCYQWMFSQDSIMHSRYFKTGYTEVGSKVLDGQGDELCGGHHNVLPTILGRKDFCPRCWKCWGSWGRKAFRCQLSSGWVSAAESIWSGLTLRCHFDALVGYLWRVLHPTSVGLAKGQLNQNRSLTSASTPSCSLLLPLLGKYPAPKFHISISF